MVDSKNKEYLVELFKENIDYISKISKKEPLDITRDEYCYSLRFLDTEKRLTKDNISFLGGYRNLLENVFSNNDDDKDNEDDEDDEYQKLIEFVLEYIKENNSLPPLNKVKKYFNSIKEVFDTLLKTYPEIKNYIFNEYEFTEDYYKNVLDVINKHKRFIITTAVSGKKVNEGFYNCLKNYCNRNDAVTLILPCEDIIDRRTGTQWNLDPLLRDSLVIFKDTNLNNNIFISDIKVSAKMLLPTTGVSRLSKNRKSMILASPKQFLEFIPTSNSKMPVAIMTTGAITTDDYSTDFYMSKRLSKLAENDHKIACVLVEIEDENIFHFRQMQYLEDKIIDLGVEYYSNGDINKAENTICIFGDSHVIEKDDRVHKVVKDVVNKVYIKDIVLHDIFDGICVSHHNSNKPVVRAIDYLNKNSSIEEEGKKIKSYLEEVGAWIDGDLHIIYSNHNTFLQRYLEEGRYINDNVNCYYAHYLALALMEGKDPLRYMLEDRIGLSDNISVKWWDADEDFKMYGFNLNVHGHLGVSGSKGNIKSIEKSYEKSISAHTHSPCIFRDAFKVGTLSKKKLSYVKGVSNWVQGVGLLYSNGSVQIINIINEDDRISWKI